MAGSIQSSTSSNRRKWIVGVENATHRGSCALFERDPNDVNGAVRVVGQTSWTQGSHSTQLLPAIKSLLQEGSISPGELAELWVGVGPGSFTGLRIVVATVKSLAYALKIPIRAFSSLQLLVEPAPDQFQLAIAVMDARQGDLFVGGFERGSAGRWCTAMAERSVRPDELRMVLKPILENATRPVWIVGDGLQRYAELLKGLGEEASEEVYRWPLASSMARAWQTSQWVEASDDLFRLVPTYGRASRARIPNK